MAVVNPELQFQTADNFIHYSRGIGEDQSSKAGAIKSIFEGITGAGDALIKGADQGIQDNIYKDAMKGVDQTRNEYGANAATDASQGPNNTFGPVPPEVARGKDTIANLTKAWQQGTLSESDYYGKLNATVRTLKSKYPGYEQIVDQTVGSITGVNPANAVVSALKSEAEKGLAAKNSADAKWDEFLHTNAGFLPPDYNSADPSKYSRTDVENYVMHQKQLDHSREVAKSDLAIAIDEKKVQQGDFLDTAQNVATLTGQQITASGITTLGKNASDIQAKFLEWAKSGHIPTPEEQSQVSTLLLTLKQQTESAITNQLQQFIDPHDVTKGSVWSHLSEADKATAIKAGTASIDALTQAFAGPTPNLSLASVVTNYNQNTIDQAAKKLLDDPKNGSVVARVMAANKMFGPTVTQSALEATDKGMNALSNLIVIGNSADVANAAGKPGVATWMPSGQPKATPVMSDDLNKIITSGQKVDPGTYKAITMAHVNNIVNPKISVPVAESSINYLYNPKNKLLGGVDSAAVFPDAQGPAIYTNLVNPQITARVAELAKSDPKLWDTYSKWAYANLTAVVSHDIKDIQNTAPQDLATVKVRINPDTGMIDVAPSGQMINNDPGDTSTVVTRLQQIYGRINTSLSGVKSVITQDGRDLAPTVQGILGVSGLKLDLPDAEKKDKGKLGSLNFQAPVMTASLENEIPQSVLDQQAGIAGTKGFLDLIASHEAPLGYNQRFGGGQTNLTGMTVDQVAALPANTANGISSTANGKFQILDTTMPWLKDKLGLKGDEMFTPELQDKMAQALLERRGLKDFQSGKITQEQFASNLANEWTSLKTHPLPQTAFDALKGDQTAASEVKPPAPFLNVKGEPIGVNTKDLSPRASALLKGMDGAGGTLIAAYAPGVGHVKHSQHYIGNALDYSIRGMSDDEKANFLKQAIANGAKGIGIYPSGNSIHIDVRNNPMFWGPGARGIYHKARLKDAPPWAQPILQEAGIAS